MSAITELQDLLDKAKHAYYNTSKNLKVDIKNSFGYAYIALVNNNPKLWKRVIGVTIVNDDMYDDIENALKELSPKTKIGIGAIVKNKVNLPFFMGSLDKIKPGSVEKWLSSHPGPYIVMDKEDGVSIGIVYEGKTVKAYTRGDGSLGQDISYLLPHLKVPKIGADKKVRGEIIIKKSVFDSKWASEFANPRNMAAGLVNRKDIHQAVSDIDVIVYESISPRGIPSQQLKALKTEGFNVVTFKVFETLDEDDLAEYFSERKKISKYEIDGLVVMQDKKTKANTEGNPDHAVAFKMQGEADEALAEVIAVEWNASKYGLLKPKVKIKPVKLAGVTIQFATGHNAAYIKDSGIGPGALIKIVRRGEVIPYIIETVKKVKPQMPSREEFGPFSWNETGVDLILLNPSDNNDVRIKSITHFFRSIEVEDFSEGLVSRFFDAGFDSYDKIIKMKTSDMLKLDGFQQKMATKVFTNIKKSLENVYLPNLMDATGFFGKNFGSRRCEAILKQFYPEIMDWESKSVIAIKNKIITVPGFQAVLAEQFSIGLVPFIKWVSSKNIDFYFDEQDTDPKSDLLQGEKICMTGFRDVELTTTIEDNGGEISSGVTGNTTILLVADKNSSSSKTVKALAMGIPILTKPEFIKKYKL